MSNLIPGNTIITTDTGLEMIKKKEYERGVNDAAWLMVEQGYAVSDNAVDIINKLKGTK